MESNFEFLKGDTDTIDLYKTAREIEENYCKERYDVENILIRKVLEQVVKMVLDFNYINVHESSTFNDCLRTSKNHSFIPSKILKQFYELKNIGNDSVHNIVEYSHSEALENIKKFHEIMVWFATEYTEQRPRVEDFKEPKLKADYNPFERKVIYVQTANGNSDEWPAYKGAEKIGDATIKDPETDNTPNSQDLRNAAKKRVADYMGTAGVPYNIEWAELACCKVNKTWFRDYDVHDVLERSGVKRNPKLGREWFLTDLETAKAAIKAVKEGRKSLEDLSKVQDGKKFAIKLRPEQKDAVNKTVKVFKKDNKMLWNAKMRFGKTLSALYLIKKEKYQHVLIMTDRPAVDDSWFEDFRKMNMNEEGYAYGSKNNGEPISCLQKSNKPFIYFASIQDLRGSEIFGGKTGDKNREFAEIDWNLIIVDEAHEGAQTDLAKNVINGVKNENTKILELSGTPFNIMGNYDEDHIYTWDYVMEQEAKCGWEKEHPDEKNPYENLPKVSMYTFDIAEQFRDKNYTDLLDKSFNFKEFFRTDDEGEFVHKQDVIKFLDNITSPDEKTNYPFSTQKFRENLRHTLWILPGVKEANALEKLMKKHQVFGFGYNIVNVVKDDKSDNVETSNANDLKKVRDAIGNDPSSTRTITLTVRKLTTGVNVPEWTGVVFLSNTTSAMQYLQAAFRAQTPFFDEKMGRKAECFIFDFAPDRALTVMAESSRLNTGVGKKTSAVQKEQMAKLLNFLPIIGESGNGMKRYEVDSLLTKIKRVYAEKAVKTGFDDDSLYSDNLLTLNDADLKEFNKLKAIVGTTNKEKSPIKIDINKQGLSDEEYDQAERGKKKKPRERTPEEIAAMEKMKELKKQRKTMISILRSVSIRIPMMIYGMDIDIQDGVNMKKFVKLVDDVSWTEFMPKGVTKELFLAFSKYYDQEVFVEAGRIIRRKVKKLDSLDPIDRTEKLAEIFGSFRNPDKETVLTPWRVVNMQLGKTIGGYSFYDEDYRQTTVDGKSAAHWIQTNYTDDVFNSNAHILEINAKTGLYPLYAATSLYFKEFEKLNEEKAGKFTPEEEFFLWKKILRENIFVIAKTPMAKAITNRTLSGYQHLDTNVEYIENIVEDSKENSSKEAKLVRSRFNNMKFDVVIGNPPYTEKDGGAGSSGSPIYQNFVELSKKLDPKYISLITPSRWFVGGKGLDDFRDSMLKDNQIKELHDWLTPQDIFPRTNIRGGVSFFLWEKGYDNSNEGVRVVTYKDNKIVSDCFRNMKIDDIDVFIRDKVGYDFVSNNVKLLKEDNFSLHMSSRKPYGLDTSFNKKGKLSDSKIGMNDPLLCYANNGKVGFLERDKISQGFDSIDAWKVLTTRANNVGTELNDDNVNTIIASPGTVCTETYLVVGADLNLDSESSKNLSKYMKTKFFRFLHGLMKGGQDASLKTFKLIPMQDFTCESDIKWDLSIDEINRQLFRKYGLNEEECNHINTSIKEM